MVLQSPISMPYIAGLFDGEGCIGLYLNKGSKCSRYKSGYKTASWIRSVSINITYKPVLDAISAVFGGRVRLHRVAKTSKYKHLYSWQLGSKYNIECFLTTLLPYMREKHQQALVMLKEVAGNIDTLEASLVLKQMKKENS